MPVVWADIVDDEGALEGTLPTFQDVEGNGVSGFRTTMVSDFRPALVVHPGDSDADGGIAACGDFRFRSDSMGVFTGCNAGEFNNIATWHFTGLTFAATQGLAESGTSISVETRARDSERARDDEPVDTAGPVTLYRSNDTVTVVVQSGGRLGIDPNADPPFSAISKVADPDVHTATIGTVLISENMVEKPDGSPMMLEDLIDTADVTISHGVLTDDAFTRVTMGSFRAPTATNEISDDGEVVFEVDVEDLATGPGSMERRTRSSGSHPIVVTFSGREAISAWDAGSATVSFNAPRSISDNDYLEATGGSGSLASFSRGGLNTQLNMAQSTYGDGATRYQSWVRIHNNGVGSGSVTITVYDAESGDRLGHWDSPTIPAGAAIQVSAAALENHLDYTPSSGQQYNLSVEGNINGYAQHVMWNTVDGLFSDLSGFRTGGGLNTTP